MKTIPKGTRLIMANAHGVVASMYAHVDIPPEDYMMQGFKHYDEAIRHKTSYLVLSPQTPSNPETFQWQE